MRYVFVILLSIMLLPGVSQARLLFDGRHPNQERPVNRKPPNKVGEKRVVKMLSRFERIKMAKVAFITKQLDLTPAQNEKFWPIYNEYQDKFELLQLKKRLNNLNQASVKERLAVDYQILNLKSQYDEEFAKILPPEKVTLIYKSEQQFNDEMVNKLKGEKEQIAN